MTVREINIEEGMPFVKDAMSMLEQEISRAKKAKVQALKIIHGYGSTGAGGKIKTATFKLLTEKKSKKEIKNFILGDKWSIFDEATRAVLDLSTEMSKDRDLDKCNIGITIVVL